MNTEDILITIIVPVYNVIDYLPQCLDSLLCQTHSNIEIIIIDDGSSDGCGKMIDEYARLDQRIKVIHTQNSGLSAARNRGLDASSGDYLMFVDSDDYVERDFCKDALNLAISHQVEVVSFGYNSFWSNNDNRIDQSTSEPRLLNKEDAIRELIERKDVFYNMVWNKFFSHYLFNGIRFPEGRTFEDVAVMHLVFDRITSGVYVSEKILYNYRQARTESIMSNSTTSLHLHDRLTNEFERYSFIKDKYPALEQSQLIWLIHIFLLCFIFLPKDSSDLRDVKLFLNGNKKKVISATSGLRKVRFLLYYHIPPLFKLVNLYIKRQV